MIKNCVRLLLNLGYPFFRRILSYQVYTYLTVGTINTALNIILFMLCHKFLITYRLAVETSTVIALIITIFSGYWLQKNLVFITHIKEEEQSKNQLLKYSLVALQGQFSAYLLIKAMIILLHIHATTAYFVTTIIMLVINYFLQKYFTFRKEKQLAQAP